MNERSVFSWKRNFPTVPKFVCAVWNVWGIKKMRSIRTAVKFAFFAGAVFSATWLLGAGFQVQEQGASNLGTANAGAVANANGDATAAFWNPSAVSFADFKVGNTLVNAGINFVVPTLGLSNERGNFDCAVMSYVPNFYMAHKFTEDLAATVSVTAPYGLESSYDYDWYGRVQGLRSYLLTCDINPSLVYKITDWFSVSGGVSLQYLDCNLTQYMMGKIDLRGHSWGVGGNIGFTINYMEGGRFGFHWRSAVTQDLDGTFRMNGIPMSPISTSVDMPNTFNFGIYQRLQGDFSQFAVMLDYVYTTWSSFDKLEVPPFPPVEEDWKDTSRVAFGIHYYPEQIENLTLRFGVAYDESPVKSAEMRTVRIPCSDRIWFSGGVGYKWDIFSFDVAYSYIMCVGSSQINRTENGMTVSGHYYGHIHVVSLQAGIEF